MIERKYRHMPEGGFPMGVFEAPVNPLVLVNAEGISAYTCVEYEKKATLEEFARDPSGKMVLMVWQGKYKSDVFEIRPEDVPIILGK